MSASLVVARLTLRQLLGRRRVLLLLLLAALLVVVALVYRLTGNEGLRAEIFTGRLLSDFGLATLMPLVALLLGTAAIGAEIEDGTAIYLLSKPIPRASVLLTKLFIAAVGSILLTCIPILLAGWLTGSGMNNGVALAMAVGAAFGALVYCGIFVALSLVTGRALVFGLLYVLVWEGLLAGLFPGTRTISVRQQSLAIADALTDAPERVLHAQLDLTTALVVGGIILIGVIVLGIQRLRRFEIAGETA
jgi:ABC-2 type transport system permease protein